jgi:hypothetical protein
MQLIQLKHLYIVANPPCSVTQGATQDYVYLTLQEDLEPCCKL